MRKSISLSLLICFFIFSFTLLSNALEAKTENSKKESIVFYYVLGRNEDELLQEQIKKFETENQDYEVLAYNFGNYDAVTKKVINKLQVHEEPQIIMTQPEDISRYLTTSQVIDLNKFIHNQEVGLEEEVLNDLKMGGYYEEGLGKHYSDISKYGYNDNSLLSIPFMKTTDVMYYNEEALKELNVEVPKTFKELVDVLKLAKKKWPNSTPLGIDSLINFFEAYLYNNEIPYTSLDSNNHYLFNNQKAANFLDELSKLTKSGLMTTKSLYGNYLSSLFSKGKENGSIFLISNSTSSGYLRGSFKIGVTSLPFKEVSFKGPSLAMLNCESENGNAKVLMAWKFLKDYLLDKTFLEELSLRTGYNPVLKSIADSQDYNNSLASYSYVSKEVNLISKNYKYYINNNFIGSSRVTSELKTAIIETLKNEKNGLDALNDAYIKCGGR